jgi:hypothetical protein
MSTVGITKLVSQVSYSGDAETPPAYNNTDVIYQETRVYIEGVQVPFITASVSQVYGELPTATIDIPPESGLLDITRGYSPKVHIFYEDRISGGFRLLFWGHIMASSYARSRSPGDSYISFSCVHKNHLVRSALLDYAGWIQTNSTELTDSEGAMKAGHFNSNETIVSALQGLTGVASDSKDLLTPNNTSILTANTTLADPSLSAMYERLIGIPGVAVNLWNQMKRFSYLKPEMNINVSSITAPLIDEGIAFFKRMSGHRYLEYALQFSKEAYCHETGTEKNVLIPPAFQNPLISAVKSEVAVNAVRSQVAHSGEYTDFLGLLQTFLAGIGYDLITLACPAEVAASPLVKDALPDSGYAGKERIAVETVIKPQLPFYFSPTCNVVLPRMYSSVNIQQQESSAPTRVLAYHSTDASGANNQLYRGPHSIREATAYGAMLRDKDQTKAPLLSLQGTFGISYNVPGKYEQGTGIRPTKLALPWWLAAASVSAPTNSNTQEAVPDTTSLSYREGLKMSAAWDERYSKDTPQKYAPGKDTREISEEKQKLNPYNLKEPTVSPFQRLLISALDYEYAKMFTTTRSGTVDCVFNPYIIPGYPMDVIDDSPNHPCFHARCTSVTHSITPSSIDTSVGMSDVTTYAELSNFYHPPAHPALQTSLNVINATMPDTLSSTVGDTAGITDIRSTILQNTEAKSAADEFYRSVLGVGAAAPDDMYDFKTGRVNGLTRYEGILFATGPSQAVKTSGKTLGNGGQLNDYLSTTGNLRLIHRKVETRASIEAKFPYTFIDLNNTNYNETVIQYVNPIQASGALLEPGASMFLDYLEVKDFINLCKLKDTQ